MERVIQRRNIMAAAGLWSVAMLGHARAQVATPQATELPRVDHPIHGTWEWSNDLNDFSSQSDPDFRPTPIIFSKDGTCLEYDAVFGVGIGFWRTLDAQHGEVVMQYQTLAGPWLNIQGPVAFFDPDHVPAPSTFGQGFIVSRSTLIVADDGDRLTLSGIAQAWTGGAKPTKQFEGPLARTGKRLST
jgi:hypothetical protein